MRFIFKVLLVLLVLVIVTAASGATYVWWHLQSCSSVRQCYWAWKAMTSGADPMDQRRYFAIHDGFTASRELVAFQVPVSLTANGILLHERGDRRAGIIARDGYTYWSPRFSEDGERMVLVRRNISKSENELLSCSVTDWRCAVVLRSTDPINSPVEIGNGEILYAQGVTVERQGKPLQAKRYDLFLVGAKHPPSRLTDFEFLGLHKISASSDKIYFSAVGGKSRSTAAECPDPVKCNSSEIFGLDLDREMSRISNKPETLAPAFIIDGLSVTPAISGDGTRLAFLNTSREKFTYRYNLKVGKPSESVTTIALKGIDFSVPVFVGEAMLVNELFKDRFRVSVFDRDLNLAGTLDIDHSPQFLDRLHRIELSVEPVGRAS